MASVSTNRSKERKLKKRLQKQYIESGNYKSEEKAINAANNEAMRIMNENLGHGWRNIGISAGYCGGISESHYHDMN